MSRVDNAPQHALPRMSQMVVVWPALRTVRGEDRQPVMQDGEALKKPARVRDAAGNLITGPLGVQVNAYYIRLINGGALAWCARDEYLAQQRGNAAAAAVEQDQPAASARKSKRTGEVEQPQPDQSQTNN